MKNKFYTFVALIATTLVILPAFSLKAKPINDTVVMGPGYGNEVYYNMTSGIKGTLSRKQWDIAFRANIRSASILTNDAANNSALGINGVELYAYPKADTNGWASVDTAGLKHWKLLVNSTTDWETGAFCQNQLGHPDYGWGKYNSASHDVVGDSLFIIKLPDGSFRKLWIVRKYSSLNMFKFRFANLDGTSDTTVMLDCNAYAAKNFVRFSLSKKQMIDFEPAASTQWDILFTKYMYTYPNGDIYPVTGVLSNYGIKVNAFHHVPLTYTAFDLGSMDSTRSPIGWEWKSLNTATYTYDLVDSLVYFVQDHGKNIHKLVFKEFVGSSTGRISFQKEMISAAGINDIPTSGMNAAVYPNPVNGVMNLVINPEAARQATVVLMDMSGRIVLNKQFSLQPESLSTLQIPVSDVPAGMYIVKVQAGANTVSHKVVVNN